MTMGRASMGKQIATTRSSKGAVKKADGGLMALSPAASLAKSLQSGKPEGLMKMLPLGAAMAAGQKGKVSPAEKAKAAAAGKPAPMKSGGRVKKGKH